MDEFKRLRYLIPVFWLLALVVSAAYVKPDRTSELITGATTRLDRALGNQGQSDQPAHPETRQDQQTAAAEGSGWQAVTTDGKLLAAVVTAVAAGGFVIFTAGYLLASLAITVASLLGLLLKLVGKNWHWETGRISSEDRTKLQESLGYQGKKRVRSIYLVNAYHHGILTDGIADLLARRWTLLMIGLNCLITTLATAGGLWWARLFPRWDSRWCLVAAVLVFCILWCTVSAWWYVREMTRLLLRCDKIPQRKS